MMGRALLPTADGSRMLISARLAMRGMFRCVTTRTTPGAASAADTSRRVIVPRVTVLCTSAA